MPIPFARPKSAPLAAVPRRRDEQGIRRRKQRWRRAFAVGLGLPALLLSGACGAYYYRLHQLCNSLSISDLPRAVPPIPPRRILVISPHCDDETLGAGGFIADCRKAGVPVTIAFITNGDGFRAAASRTLHEVSVGPSDFIRFAEKRQTESLQADGELGVAAPNVVFMGYPDRGLKPLWEENWDKNHLFRSPYTGHTRCPYARAYKPRALYCGASLLADLSGLMESVRPTDILVTHPADDHPDHSAASAFVDAALTACKMKGDNWAQSARLRYYIVHRGDWPLPQGSHPDRPLTPPPGLLARDTKWSAYPVTHEGGAAKARALSRYESQMAISGRFLVSFERTNELFAELPTPEVPPLLAHSPLQAATVQAEREAGSSDTRPAASGLSAFWHDATRAPQSGSGDNFARFADPATDLTGVSLRRVGKNRVAVRVTTRGAVSGRVRYRVALRGLPAPVFPLDKAMLAPASQMVSLPVPVSANTAIGGGGRNRSARPNFVEQIVPLASLGLLPESGGYVWAQAETRWLNRLPMVDRTGYRAFYVPAETASEMGEDAMTPSPVLVPPTQTSIITSPMAPSNGE